MLTTFQLLGMNNIGQKKCVNFFKHEVGDDSLYNIKDVDSIPVFSNRIELDIKIALTKELVNHIIYPQEAIEKDIHGKVYLSFIIDSKGVISSIKVIRGVQEIIDKAAVEAVSKINVTRPAMKKNKPVDVIIIYPVTFNIE